MGRRVSNFFDNVSFGLLGYRMDRSHSIMRIATTASPISGAEIRDRAEILSSVKTVRHALNTISLAWLDYKERQTKKENDLMRRVASMNSIAGIHAEIVRVASMNSMSSIRRAINSSGHLSVMDDEDDDTGMKRELSMNYLARLQNVINSQNNLNIMDCKENQSSTNPSGRMIERKDRISTNEDNILYDENTFNYIF